LDTYNPSPLSFLPSSSLSSSFLSLSQIRVFGLGFLELSLELLEWIFGGFLSSSSSNNKAS